MKKYWDNLASCSIIKISICNKLHFCKIGILEKEKKKIKWYKITKSKGNKIWIFLKYRICKPFMKKCIELYWQTLKIIK